MKWTFEEIEQAKKLIVEGKSFKTIGIILNKTHYSVTAKLHKLGYKSGFKPNYNKGVTKYEDYDWLTIQKNMTIFI